MVQLTVVSYTKGLRAGKQVDAMSTTRSLGVMKLPAEVFSSNLAGRQFTATPPTMVFDEQQPLLQWTDHYLKVLD